MKIPEVILFSAPTLEASYLDIILTMTNAMMIKYLIASRSNVLTFLCQNIINELISTVISTCQVHKNLLLASEDKKEDVIDVEDKLAETRKSILLPLTDNNKLVNFISSDRKNLQRSAYTWQPPWHQHQTAPSGQRPRPRSVAVPCRDY